MATSDMLGFFTQLLGGEENTDVTKGGTSTTTGTSTQTSNADISALQEVYKKQAAGITPDMLEAIFAEGSKKIPSLTAAYANAVGARSGGNSPLGVTLRDLNAELTYDAAKINQSMLADSGKTAAQIADLTKALTTTNNSTTTNTENTSVDTTKTIDPNSLKWLLGGAAGISGLDWLLGGNGATGGLNDVFKSITGVGASGIPGFIKSLFGDTGGGGVEPDLSWLDNLPEGIDTNLDWLAEGIDFGDFTDFNWTDLGFADGGLVQKMADGGVPANVQQQLLKMLMLKKMASTPEGQQRLRQMMTAQKGTSGLAEAQGADFASPDRLNFYKDAETKFMRNYEKTNPYQGMDRGIGSWANYTPAQREEMGFNTADMTRGEQEGQLYSQAGKQAFMQTLSPRQRYEYMKVAAASKAKQDATAKGIGAAGFSLIGGLPALQAGLGALAGGAGLADAISAYSGASSLISKLPSLAFKGANLGQMLASMGGERTGGSANYDPAAILQALAAARDSKMQTQQVSQPQETSTGYADGGEVEEGVEDNIPIMVSEGEYVIPADVVRKKGTDFFDKMIENSHTPAALQKAMGL